MTEEECWKECEYANPKSEIISAYLMKKKENEQLKQKIERMKNHENCKHHSQYSRMHTFYADDKIICYKCKNCSLWELAE